MDASKALCVLGSPRAVSGAVKFSPLGHAALCADGLIHVHTAQRVRSLGFQGEGEPRDHEEGSDGLGGRGRKRMRPSDAHRVMVLQHIISHAHRANPNETELRGPLEEIKVGAMGAVAEGPVPPHLFAFAAKLFTQARGGPPVRPWTNVVDFAWSTVGAVGGSYASSCLLARLTEGGALVLHKEVANDRTGAGWEALPIRLDHIIMHRIVRGDFPGALDGVDESLAINIWCNMAKEQQFVLPLSDLQRCKFRLRSMGATEYKCVGYHEGKLRLVGAEEAEEEVGGAGGRDAPMDTILAPRSDISQVIGMDDTIDIYRRNVEVEATESVDINAVAYVMRPHAAFARLFQWASYSCIAWGPQSHGRARLALGGHLFLAVCSLPASLDATFDDPDQVATFLTPTRCPTGSPVSAVGWASVGPAVEDAYIVAGFADGTLRVYDPASFSSPGSGYEPQVLKIAGFSSPEGINKIIVTQGLTLGGKEAEPEARDAPLLVVHALARSTWRRLYVRVDEDDATPEDATTPCRKLQVVFASVTFDPHTEGMTDLQPHASELPADPVRGATSAQAKGFVSTGTDGVVYNWDLSAEIEAVSTLLLGGVAGAAATDLPMVRRWTGKQCDAAAGSTPGCPQRVPIYATQGHAQLGIREPCFGVAMSPNMAVFAVASQKTPQLKSTSENQGNKGLTRPRVELRIQQFPWSVGAANALPVHGSLNFDDLFWLQTWDTRPSASHAVFSRPLLPHLRALVETDSPDRLLRLCRRRFGFLCASGEATTHEIKVLSWVIGLANARRVLRRAVEVGLDSLQAQGLEEESVSNYAHLFISYCNHKDPLVHGLPQPSAEDRTLRDAANGLLSSMVVAHTSELEGFPGAGRPLPLWGSARRAERQKHRATVCSRTLVPLDMSALPLSGFFECKNCNRHHGVAVKLDLGMEESLCVMCGVTCQLRHVHQAHEEEAGR